MSGQPAPSSISTHRTSRATRAADVRKKHSRRQDHEAIRFARTCYDHLAGELGVRLTKLLEENGALVVENEHLYRLTPEGETFLRRWGVDAHALRSLKRSFARRCLDWTERRDHLAGALGAAVYQGFVELGWVQHDSKNRAVYLTAKGRRHLEPLLGASMSASGRDPETSRQR